MMKKKWYETWWGLLWVLAIVDANPGRGLRVFMEVDEELKNLPEFCDEGSVEEPSHAEERARTDLCPTVPSAHCVT
jgi:hypothetical protein